MLKIFQNNPTSLTEHQKIFKRCALFEIIIALVVVIHIMRAAFEGAKRIVLKDVSLNKVNIVKITRAVGFMKPHVSLI